MRTELRWPPRSGTDRACVREIASFLVEVSGSERKKNGEQCDHGGRSVRDKESKRTSKGPDLPPLDRPRGGARREGNVNCTEGTNRGI